LSLNIDDQYLLTYSLKQETVSDDQHSSTINLDISGELYFKIRHIDSNSNYHIQLHYDELDLSFFSPHIEKSISSKSRAFNPIMHYLKELEKHHFSLILSPMGEVIQADSLDTYISTFYQHKSFSPNDDIFIKTVKEGFGEASLIGIIHASLHNYCRTPSRTCEIQSSIYYNAKSMDILKSLFYNTNQNDVSRVQGYGLIPETFDSFSSMDMSVEMSFSGDQTFDFVIDQSSGWLLSGTSKQTIQTISKIVRSKDDPEGLKIPAISKTIYTFTGKQL